MDESRDASQLLATLKWTEQQKAEFEAALPLAKPAINVAVTGVTGSGKSTIINALCGAVPRKAADVDNDGKVLESILPAEEGVTLQPETQKVTSYVAQTASFSGKTYTVKVWDSPGLEDGTGRGSTYMTRLRAECGDEIDMLLYCIDCSKTKCIISDMVPGMAAVTSILGRGVWEHSMIVLTFANLLEENIEELLSIEPDYGEDKRHIFVSRVAHWESSVRTALVQAGVPGDMAQSLPVEPAGHYTDPYLPDRIHWLGYLWVLFLTYARDEAKLAILITNQHRIRDAKYLTPEDLLQLNGSSQTPPIVIDQDHLKAVKISTTISVGVASAVGACAGGVAGGVVLGTLTAGLGVGVGLAAGAAVGAVIGPLVGMAVNKTLKKKHERETAKFDNH